MSDYREFRSFKTTDWDQVGLANDGDQNAIGELYLQYGEQLVQFARRKLHRPEDAADLVSDFFTQQFIAKQSVQADRRVGRFRTMLLTCFERFLYNRREYDQAQKRDVTRTRFVGDVGALETPAGNGMRRMPNLTPDEEFEVNCLLRDIEAAKENLRRSYAAAGNVREFDLLRQFLLFEIIDHGFTQGTPEERARRQQVAGQLGLNSGTFSTRLHRFREKFRDEIRKQLRKSVSETEIDDELRRFCHLLGRANG